MKKLELTDDDVRQNIHPSTVPDDSTQILSWLDLMLGENFGFDDLREQILQDADQITIPIINAYIDQERISPDQAKQLIELKQSIHFNEIKHQIDKMPSTLSAKQIKLVIGKIRLHQENGLISPDHAEELIKLFELSHNNN